MGVTFRIIGAMLLLIGCEYHFIDVTVIDPDFEVVFTLLIITLTFVFGCLVSMAPEYLRKFYKEIWGRKNRQRQIEREWEKLVRTKQWKAFFCYSDGDLLHLQARRIIGYDRWVDFMGDLKRITILFLVGAFSVANPLHVRQPQIILPEQVTTSTQSPNRRPDD